MVFSHLAIRVHEHDGFPIGPECKGSLVTRNALVGKVLEDLLKCGLGHTVLLDAQISLLLLKLSEKPANGLTFLGHAEFEEFTALLEDLNLLEVACEVCEDPEAIRLCFQELEKVDQAHLTIGINACFGG